MSHSAASASGLANAPVNTAHPLLLKREGSYELKFLLNDRLADEILERARAALAADPHADHRLGDGYLVNSLYFDTANFDVYHRIGAFGRRKFRLRRYGSEPQVFLERKTKSRGLVRKLRTAVPESELAWLAAANVAARADAEGHTACTRTRSGWPGYWFYRRLVLRRLLPTTMVSYHRAARVGMTPEGEIRLTVDRQIRCRPAEGVTIPSPVEGVGILTGQSIVEFKFSGAMPALFKGLVHDYLLTPGGVSKYRLSVDACGLSGASVCVPQSPLSGKPDQSSPGAPRPRNETAR